MDVDAVNYDVSKIKPITELIVKENYTIIYINYYYKKNWKEN